MSDQPTTTPPSTQSLDEILNQLEKTTGTAAAPTTPMTPSAPVAPVPPADPAPVTPPISGVSMTPAPAENPPVVSASMPDITPVPVTTPPEPTPIVEAPPVATIPENPVVPVTPMPEPTPAAPMVSEEPSLDTHTTTSLPEPVTLTPHAPETTTTAETTGKPTPPKSSPLNKVVVGILGILMLAGVAGIGVYASRMQQNTQSDAYTSPTPLVEQDTTQTANDVTPSAPAVVTEPPAAGSMDVNFTGKSCLNTTNGPGNVFVYNTAKKVFVRIPMVAGQETFVANIPAGESVAYYKTSDGATSAGYTDTTTHKLKPFTSTGSSSDAPIDVCDEKMDATSLPQGKYVPYQQ